MSALGSRIHAFRKAAGLTVAELAAKSKVRPHVLHMVERNGAGAAKLLSGQDVLRICKVFGIGVDKLLDEKTPASVKTTGGDAA